MSPPSACVILVPASGPIEPDCERGLRGLEAKGYPIRRAFGFSAIDFGRSVLASQALREGFAELMWIDSDIGFDPRDVDRLRSHNLHLCCALYPKKDRKGFACAFLPGTENVPFGEGGTLTEVKYAGFGFVHTRREVYDCIRAQFSLAECNQRFGPPIEPWFLPEVVPDGAGRWYLPEDCKHSVKWRVVLGWWVAGAGPRDHPRMDWARVPWRWAQASGSRCFTSAVWWASWVSRSEK